MSPFATGGGSTTFEHQAAAFYLVQLIRGDQARGAPNGSLVRVKLQQRNQGHFVDDVVLVSDYNGELRRLSLQVKHGIRFTAANEAFVDAIEQCWREYRRPSFDAAADLVGLCVDHGSYIQTVRQHFQELLTWARAMPADDFRRQVTATAAKQGYYTIIKGIVDSCADGPVPDDVVYDFLRHFVLVHFDFAGPPPEHGELAQNLIRQVIPPTGDDTSAAVFAWLRTLAADTAKAGGQQTTATVLEAVPTGLELLPPEAARSNLESTSLRLRLHNDGRLEREVRSGKFIPSLFIESAKAKDHARAFCDPLWGIRYLAYRLARQRFGEVDRHLIDLGLPAIDSIAPAVTQPASLVGVATCCDELTRHIEPIVTRLSLMQEHYAEDLLPEIPADRRYIYDESRYALGTRAYWPMRWLSAQRDWLRYIDARILCLTAAAGQGKTSLICDLLAHVLQPRQIPYIHLTGRACRAWTGGPLETFMLAEVFGAGAVGNETHLMHQLRTHATDRAAPLVIVIDGINEHGDISAFSAAIEGLLDRLSREDWIRVIITCRSEYFEARFGQLRHAACAPHMVQLQEPMLQCTEQHTAHMVRGYCREFGLDVAHISGAVFEKLRRDPLLLRLFCEAYGSTSGNPPQALPPFHNLHKDDLYARLFARKLDEGQGDAPALGASTQLREATNALLDQMLGSAEYVHVPLGSIDPKHLPSLQILLDQELILRRDLATSALSPNAEVLAFTFDEMRDYLLAERVAEHLWSVDVETAVDAMAALTDQKSPTAEGVGRFLFLCARREEHTALLEHIAAQEWYDAVFFDSVFDLEDKYISDSDVEKVIAAFCDNEELATRIVLRLIVSRHSRTRFPTLNLRALLDALDTMDDSRIRSRLFSAFDSSRSWPLCSNPVWPIEDFADKILDWSTDHTCDELQTENDLLLLLMYLLPVNGEHTWSPASGTLDQIAERCPDAFLTVATEFLSRRANPGTAMALRKLEDLAHSGSPLTPELIEIIAGSFAPAAAETELESNIRIARARVARVLVARGALALPAAVKEELDEAVGPETMPWLPFS